jgi:hypothetical protein
VKPVRQNTKGWSASGLQWKPETYTHWTERRRRKKMEQIPRKKIAVQTGASRTIRLSEWAYARLLRAHEKLRVEIGANPQNYGGYAGKRLTLSDVVVLMTEMTER